MKKEVRPMYRNASMEFARKLMHMYSERSKPLCKELKLPQTAFDILLFLGNHPQFQTARDIVERRGLKANLVSVNVDRLVQDGYLIRKESPDDRRKTILLCTEKAVPVIERGQQMQDTFMKDIAQGIDEETKAAFIQALQLMEKNLDSMMKERED